MMRLERSHQGRLQSLEQPKSSCSDKEFPREHS